MGITPRKGLAGRLRFKHLELFQNVVDHHTLRAAAEVSSMSQPAATKLVQELEEMFGVPLFQRGKRGMRPTHYGEVMRRHIAIVLADIDRMRQEIALVAEGGEGHIRLGVLPSLAPGLLTRSVDKMLGAHPKVQFSITEAASTELLASLSRNELDLTFARIMPGEVVEGVRHGTVYVEPFAVVARRGHPLARARRLTWKLLSDATWILPAKDTPMRNFIDEWFGRNAAFRPRVAIECSTLEKVRDLIAGTDMVGVLPRSFLLNGARRKDLAPLKVGLDPNFAPISLVFRQHRELAPVVDAFAKAVRAAAVELGLH